MSTLREEAERAMREEAEPYDCIGIEKAVSIAVALVERERVKTQAAYRIGVARGGSTMAGYSSNIMSENGKRILREMLEEYPKVTDEESDAEAERCAPLPGEETR
mgnify:CR=1 FL=1